jgi:hypothetical protein
LLKNGYIKLRKNWATRGRYALFRIGLTPENLLRILPYKMASGTDFRSSTKGAKEPFLARVFRAALLDKERDVDWARSRAYAFRGEGVGMIYTTDKAQPSSKSSLPAEIKAKLSSELDSVFLGTEIYNPETDDPDIPDVVAFDSSSEFVVLTNPRFFTSNRIKVRKYGHSEASHSMRGIFVSSASVGIADRIEEVHELVLRYFEIANGTKKPAPS